MERVAASPDTAPMRAWHPIATQLLAWPRGLAVFAIVGVSVSASLGATALSLLLLKPADIGWAIPMTIAFLVPLLVSWPVALVLMRLLRDLEAAHQAASRQASTDMLTGLLNRPRWLELAERECKRARTDGAPIAVLLLDVDHFKHINDTQGHQHGDRVLVALANAIGQSLRPADVLARWGGQEFVALLPRATLAAALQAAERLRLAAQACSQRIGEHALQVTVSIGVSVHQGNAAGALYPPLEAAAGAPDGAASPLQRLLQRAETALHRAKAGGRNRCETA